MTQSSSAPAIPDWKSLDVGEARRTIARLVMRTPVVEAPSVARGGDRVWLKLENLQVTGSFKVRGAANRMAVLSGSERRRGVIACSSGNHGRAVAYVAQRLGIAATICVPEWVDPSKLDAMRAHEAEVVLAGATYDEAEAHAVDLARRGGAVLVHPFDDPRVIAGQGTIGLELLEQVLTLDTVVVPVSGGGLVAGVAAALRRERPDLCVVGVSAERARVMYESVHAGHPLELSEEETIAGALAGGIGLENRYSFPWVRDLVTEHVLVSEDEIRRAMRLAATELKLVVEGGGAVGLAAVLAGKVVGKSVAVVVSGGNIDPVALAGVLTS